MGHRRAGVAAALLMGSLLLVGRPAACADEPVAASAAEPVAAAPDSAQDPLVAQLDEWLGAEDPVADMFAPLNERLKLTPDQVAQVTPVLAAGVTELKVLREQARLGTVSGMTLMMQMTATGKQMADRITPHLDAAQALEYGALRQEQRQKLMQTMLERMRAQQSAVQ